MSGALKIEDLRVRSLDVDFHEVSWKVCSTTLDVFDYTFQVLRSEGPEGPYDPISEEFQDQYLFVDNNIAKFHEHRQFYYKLRVRNRLTGEEVEHGPVQHAPEADLIATELRKHMNLLFREFIGRRCWVLPIRTFGTRCPDCWDATLQKVTKSQCFTCFATGFTGGFLRPIEAWVSIDPTPKAEQNTGVGPLQQKDTTARMGFWPPLKPRDIIIEPENLRWRVNTITTTQQLRAPVHQEIGIHRIPSSDIEYRVELELDKALKDMWLGPARNFSNPHSLEGFTDEEYPDVLQLYEGSYQVRT